MVCVAVQTPNKLLKSLVASKMEKGSKPNKEHDAQIATQARKDAEKEFKQIAEKVMFKIVFILCTKTLKRLNFEQSLLRSI